MSLFSGLGNSLFGVPPVSSAPATQQQQTDQASAAGYAGREQSGYNAQQQLADSLWNTINGKGPSVADIRLQQALDQGLKQSMAMGAGATGQNAVLARFLAGQGYDPAQAAQAGALLKAQETQNAQQQLQGLTGTMAGESGNLYGANLSNGLGYANLANQINEANAQRSQQAETAGLNALAGAGSLFFGAAPKIGIGGGSSSGGSSGGSSPYVDPFTQGTYNQLPINSDSRATAAMGW